MQKKKLSVKFLRKIAAKLLFRRISPISRQDLKTHFHNFSCSRSSSRSRSLAGTELKRSKDSTDKEMFIACVQLGKRFALKNGMLRRNDCYEAFLLS